MVFHFITPVLIHSVFCVLSLVEQLFVQNFLNSYWVEVLVSQYFKLFHKLTFLEAVFT